MSTKILEVKNLVTQFKTNTGYTTAIDDISFDLYRGKSFGIVGESGSGKSVTALSIMRLITPPLGKIVNGEVLFEGNDILQLSTGDMRKIRGNKISMIFQEPMTSLNPVYTVGNQISETLMLHRNISKKEAYNQCIELLNLVGIPAPTRRIDDYPHQLSGGMRQRIMIAMALACNPSVLIADEPTTALDVTIQAQILDLMAKLQEEMGMGIIMITHDLGVIAEFCDEVAVMYCGKIIEQTTVQTLFKQPLHPYTKGLIGAIPSLDPDKQGSQRLQTIEGTVVSRRNLPSGCSFQNRCQYVQDDCRGVQGVPKLTSAQKDHDVACFHPLYSIKDSY